MKIVQTFWTAGEDPLEYNYGWPNSSTNIMAWALSCLSLREYYNDVHLYTDSRAFNLLHNQLKLPYNQFHITYDHLTFNKNLWALAKIYTYSYQRERFIHVDGDIFISKKLPNEFDSADLIAQNKEKGTPYYKNIIENLSCELNYMPDYLQKELNALSIDSYNLGIFGGKDIPFIQKFCQSALEFVHGNQLHQKNYSSTNINILFEQVIFSALLKTKHKKATCLINQIINDNGYTYNSFCDFLAFRFKINYLHIIGGHKQNAIVCELIERTLLNYYPEYYKRINALFQSKKNAKSNKTLSPQSDKNLTNAVIKCIEEIQDIKFEKTKEDFLRSLQKHISAFKHTQNNVLDNIKMSFITSFSFLHYPVSKQLEIKLRAHPNLFICRSSFNWPAKIKSKIKNHLKHGAFDNESCLVFLPEEHDREYRTVGIDRLSYNILILLEEALPFKVLLEEVKECFNEKFDNASNKILLQLLVMKLKFLFFNKCVIIS